MQGDVPPVDLCVFVTDENTRLHYADDIVLCRTRSEVVENKLEEWRRAMEGIGLMITIKKTVYLRFNVDRN